jgi:hypothetical protein
VRRRGRLKTKRLKQETKNNNDREMRKERNQTEENEK